MSIYLTLPGFKSLTVIPGSYVDEVETVEAGWVAAQLEYWARWIDARLRKRYASPFAAHDADPPTPPAVQGWLARIVTSRVMLKRGVDQNDEQFLSVARDAEAAMAEVQEAANSDVGLFDLPERTSADGSLIRRGPLGYTEASPYVARDGQATSGRAQDQSGGGTFHG